MDIRRDFYLSKLISRMGNGQVKVVTGVRRCGKSYLLNTLFYGYLISNGVPEDHIIRFAFDSADDLEMIGEDIVDILNKKVDPRKFMQYVKSKCSNNDKYYLLLDEVQLMDSFESVLNGYLRKSNMDLYVTGSNAKFLSKDIITEFSGRGDEIHMYPLSFAEFMSVYPGDRYEGLSQYMTYGGIPLVALCRDTGDKADLLSHLYKEIYVSDIVRRYQVRNVGELEELLNILSSSIGSLTNPEKLQRTFRSVKHSKITSPTIQKYLGYLEDSFLVEAATRYDIKGRSYIETPQKYYFSDLGLRNVRISFRQIEPTHSMENIIYNELRMRGYNVDIGVVPIVELNDDGKQQRKQLEIDFVCNKGSARYYIQSAYSVPDEDKRIQETRPFSKIKDSFKKILITADMISPHYDEDGILIVNLHDFLLDPTVIER